MLPAASILALDALLNMKLINAATLIGLLLLLAHAQEVIPIGIDSLEFVLPSGFTQVSHKEEVPRYAYADESKTGFIEIYLPRVLLTPDDLEEYKKTVIETTKLNVPNLKWLKREIITRDRTRWIQLSYRARAKDKRMMRNDIYVTSLNNEPLYVSFIYPNSESKKYRDIQSKVLKSVKFNRKAASNNSFNRSAG